MNSKEKRLSPILSALLVYIPVAILAAEPLYSHNIHFNALETLEVLLYGLIISGAVVTSLRIVKLIGKEWLSPLIAGLLISPLIFALFVWCAIGFATAFT
ncbi:MAG: hypothetical protein ACSHYA_03405 [Opitutaceae bacterium]